MDPAAISAGFMLPLEQRGEYLDSDAKIKQRLSSRLAEETRKFLRIRKSGRQSTIAKVVMHDHVERPSYFLPELDCTSPSTPPFGSPPVELPCQEFVQDDRNIPDSYLQYHQALFVASPQLELRRIKRSGGVWTPRTCEWLADKGPFRQWVAGTGPQVLRIIGEANMGKTTLMAFLIERLSTTLRVTQGMMLAYHFCDNEITTTNTAIAIVKNILYQLFQQQPEHFHFLQAKYDDHKHELFKDITLLWEVLCDIIQAFGYEDNLFIVVDALHKCDERDCDLLLDHLAGIAHYHKNVRFLFTCRPVEWESWPRAAKLGFASLTINHRDIADDIKKLLDDKLPKFRGNYRCWGETEEYKVRIALNNITGTWPVSGIRFLEEGRHRQDADFVDKLVEYLRVVPEQIDFKRSLSLHLLKDSSLDDCRSTHSLPAYTGRPNSFIATTQLQQPSTSLATGSDEDREDTIELLRSSLNSVAGNPPASEPFSIVPTPATSRNPSHIKPGGWQSPFPGMEEGDDAEGQNSAFDNYRRGIQHMEFSRSEMKRSDSFKDETGSIGFNIPPTSTFVRLSPPPSDVSNQSQSEPLFNPAHPVSIFIARVRAHAKDIVFFVLLLYTFRPIWIKVDWRVLASIVAGVTGAAYLLYETQLRILKTRQTEQPPTDDEESGTNSGPHSSGSFSAFTSTIIRLIGRIKRRGQDEDENNSPSSPSPPSPPDPNFGFTANEHHNPSSVSFWVVACLIVFTGLGGFAAVAQTIACVRVHDESLLNDYILPTRDDTDHWELLSGSSLLVATIFLQSAVSIPHVRENKDAYMPHWICLWVCNGICITSIPCAWRLYLEWKYVSKAVTGAGNLTQVVVTFLTMLQIVQETAEKQRHERERGLCVEMDELRQENFRLRSVKGVMNAPPTPPDSDC